MSKVELFKVLIKEFHEKPFPEIKKRELELPDTKKTIALVGPRRVGKTFYFLGLAKQFEEKGIEKERIVYVNFEDDRILPLKIGDLNDLVEAYFELYPENKKKETIFLFDEIQNINGWESFVRRLYDKENSKIFVTGSSSKLLSKEIATALRGRTISYELFPLSFREFLEIKNVALQKDFEYSSDRFIVKKLFEEYLVFGGFPEVTLEQELLKQKILSDYFELTIYKDLAERFSVRNTLLLKNLAKFLLTNMTSIFSINSYYKTVSKEMPVSKDTIMEYLSHLQDINFIFLAPIFSYSAKIQQANPKKVFCIDNGLRNAVAFTFSKDQGKIAENLAFIELKRREKQVYYWKNKHETDFVIKNKDNSLEAINVTYSNEISQREIQGLLEFKKQFKKTKKLLILTKDTEKKEQEITFTPLWKWLLQK